MPQLCNVPGCRSHQEKRGWCEKHYRRWQRRGTTDLVPIVRPSAQDRFWQKVDKDGPVHPVLKSRCWVWTGCKNGPDGYGVIRADKPSVYVHRFSYILHFGAILGDDFVCHKCDVKVCVNPAHLFLGTLQDNTADKVSKNRQLKGEQIKQARLTAKQVRDIRRRCVLGHPRHGLSAIAREYGVAVQTISFVVSGYTWKHVK